jgi:hypothetical protein
MLLDPWMSAKTEDARRTTVARPKMSPWAWTAVTCLLLGVSGVDRFWRERKFSALAAQNKVSPFPLSQLPWEMGTWRATEREDAKLDPAIARTFGASEHIIREYRDDQTEERAAILVAYGLGRLVSPHAPDFCYPNAGYKLVKGPVDRTITVPGVKAPVRFRWATYSKLVAGITHYEESYYTFLHNGDWLPEAMAERWRMFPHHPGLFKVQIFHPTYSLSEDGAGPCESLLAAIVRQIDERSSPSGHGKDTAAPPLISSVTQ